MSRPTRLPSGATLPTSINRSVSLTSGKSDSRAPALTAISRRSSISNLNLNLKTTSGPKAQRTSKTSQKLVVLPSAPQTKPFQSDFLHHGYETDNGIRETKSEAERMSKEERKLAGFKRITAYCIAEAFRMKLLASFLKREHNVFPRVFDEALYVMYHLPLLPGYGPNSNVRSSAPPDTLGKKSYTSRLSEAEENGYQDTYFASAQEPRSARDGYMSSGSPVEARHSALHNHIPDESDADADGEEEQDRTPRSKKDDSIAEVIFFEYGVAVFFGLDEGQERSVLEDLDRAGIVKRGFKEDDWEVEECHYAHDPNIAYPRIYNDFFTFKSPSHLLKLSVSHALAQSTLLAHYESLSSQTLSSPLTLSIPRQLATTGALHLSRTEALKLTGMLFKLRRDVNLVSNVLDIPELFWSEASLGGLYGAVREYLEIGGRVQVLDEKLVVASGFLDAIHDHLNNSAMKRITWIIIWLIVVAVLVELGEVMARLVVHANTSASARMPIPKDNGLGILR